MSTELTLDLVQQNLKPKQRLLITEETVQEIQKLAEDPDYGEEFLDSYLAHLNILKESVRNNHTQYLNAIKFFTLVEAGNSLTDAYIKVFPQRYADRNRKLPESERSKECMRSEASRYNNSMLVNEIRKVAAIPVQLIHRHLLHEAILETANLMRTARSEMVKQKAAQTLITELKPPEDTQIKIGVEDGATSVIEELQKATAALAASQHTAVQAGVPMKEIAESNIIDVTPEEISE